MSNTVALPPHTIDSFLGGRVALVQPKKGHRAGLDAALLQAVVPADASGLLVDLGAGVGTVAFSAAARAPALRAVAVERDPELTALAEAALRLPANAGFAGRVRVVAADASDTREVRDAVAGNEAADWVLMNPPFDLPGPVSQSPDAGKRAAYVGNAELLKTWCRTAAALLCPGGTLGVIHRADALPAVLDAISGAFGGARILPAHPSADAPASRIVVTASRASRAPLTLLPGLVLHETGGGWTEKADAILRGTASLIN
ncbi:MAG: tRNA1(Val) (adenine(37)-N6)-methyltransferase [Propylenella sp.]